MRSNGCNGQEEGLCSLTCFSQVVEGFLLDDIGRICVWVMNGGTVCEDDMQIRLRFVKERVDGLSRENAGWAGVSRVTA